MPYHFIFPVGDWSGDGHAYVAEFMVKSDAPLEELRETHFANHWLGDVCSEYEDNKISFSLLHDAFGQAGVQFGYELAKKHSLNIESDQFEFSPDELTFDLLTQELKLKEETVKKYPSFVNIDHEDLINELSLEMDYNAVIDFWVFALNYYNNKLNLEVVSPAMSKYYIKYKGLPFPSDGDISFYGYDDNKRHLNTPGYGVWDCDGDSEFYLNCN